jgi:hypothetical protein
VIGEPAPSLERKPDVSVVVVCYNIARAAARTLYALSAAYQRHVDVDDFEVIVVDNGSDVPLDPTTAGDLAGNFRFIRIDAAPASPAQAINRGLRAARGEVIGVMIDGARLPTPGLLHFARHGARLYDNAVVATLGWLLGHDFQSFAIQHGYDEEREDALLNAIAWPSDGYRLFEIGMLDGSSLDGWFQPIAESNAVFARRAAWAAVGGADERFDAPGGGLVNLDTFDRLLRAPDAELVVLLGEGTFHQLHGGVHTNAPPERQRENIARWSAQYAAIRGHAWEPPTRRRPPTYIGTLPEAALARTVRAALYPGRRDIESPLGADFRHDLWTRTVAAPPSDPRIAAVVALGRDEFRAGRLEASCGVARLLRERAPAEPGLDQTLSLVAHTVRRDGPVPARRAEYHLALGEAHRILGENAAAAAQYRLALTIEPDLPRAHLGLARLRMPDADWLGVLRGVYATIAPECVVEIGEFAGESLALLQPPSFAIGVGSNVRIPSPPATETHVFAEPSDAVFAGQRLRALLGTRALSVGFINGAGLFEKALRDFIALEALGDRHSLIIINGTVPLDEATQARTRETEFHTGDVWKTVPCLKQYRPELRILTVAAAPSGLTLVSGLDPVSPVLDRSYDEAVARFADVRFSSIAADVMGALDVVPRDSGLLESWLRDLARVRTA